MEVKEATHVVQDGIDDLQESLLNCTQSGRWFVYLFTYLFCCWLAVVFDNNDNNSTREQYT